MSDNSQPSFLELLYGPHLHLYFKSVANTNMNGFSSSTPNNGLWELFVYDNLTVQTRFRSAAPNSRVIRDSFIQALMHYGTYLNAIDNKSVIYEFNRKILDHIHGTGLSDEESQHFNMFFNIVHRTKTSDTGKAKEITYADFRKLVKGDITDYRVNVKTFITELDVPGAYKGNVNRSQKGGKAPTAKLALITSFLPLVDPTDIIDENYLQKFLHQSVQVSNREGEEGEGLGGEALGGGKLRGGAIDNDEIRAAILRIILEQQFEVPTDAAPQGKFVTVLTPLQIAEYFACHDEKSNLSTPISNTATLAALPSNMWRKLSDGSFQKWTADGYKPLSKEECDKLMQDTCAGSNIPSKLCADFMEAINSQNATQILDILSNTEFVWGDNVAADTIDKLHPQTVLRILKALHFGTKSTPFGKQVCSVDEWVSECIKNTPLKDAGATLSQPMRKYLEYLVAFVNSNPSLIDPSKRPIATTTSATGPTEFTARGLYYVGGPIAGSSLLTFDKVQQAVHAISYTNIDLRNVVMQPTMGYGAVQLHGGQGQRGGTNHFYTQAATSQLLLGSGIKQLVKHALDGLKSTQQTIGPEEETKINKKVDDLIKLEQEIYHKIMQVNELRLAAQSGVNCNSQLMSAQGGLMQLGSVYDRKVPCLQELCEQLRMLLAQQQNSTNGCQPIQ